MATKEAKNAETQSVLDYFAELPDPRPNNENKRHQLLDIIAIAILATICGAEHFTEMEEWGEAKKDWLLTFCN
jgi:DDE_Tnp_1-associated